VSPYTSLVAVDTTPARAAAAPLERSNLANAVPAGSRYALALPQTATPAPLLRSAGALVLLLAAACALAELRRSTWRPS